MADIAQVLATYDALVGVALGAGLTYGFGALNRRHVEKREEATRLYEATAPASLVAQQPSVAAWAHCYRSSSPLDRGEPTSASGPALSDGASRVVEIALGSRFSEVQRLTLGAVYAPLRRVSQTSTSMTIKIKRTMARLASMRGPFSRNWSPEDDGPSTQLLTTWAHLAYGLTRALNGALAAPAPRWRQEGTRASVAGYAGRRALYRRSELLTWIRRPKK